VHGSAPDIAGQQKADPTAAIISAAMMLDFLGASDASSRITKSVEGFSPAAGLTTSQIGDAIAERV
ncbi:MAG: isocitrate/isopropylmalate family dehydrogenase, partial [Sciscionella sp.]